MHFKKTFVILSIFCLSSCFGDSSYYHQQKVAYSKAADGPELVIKPPMTTSKISDAYVIQPASKTPLFEDPPPPPGSSLDKLKNSSGKNKTNSDTSKNKSAE